MSSRIPGTGDGACEAELAVEEPLTRQDGHLEDRDGNEQEDGVINDYGLHATDNGDEISQNGSVVGDSQDGLLSFQQKLIARSPVTVDEPSSIPDDTLSLHGSAHSFQSSSAFALQGSPRDSPSPSHRPFDLRFQSRLSSSSSTNLRPHSPYLVRHHSRQSSLASQAFSYVTDSDTETIPPLWDVVRWTKLKRISGQVFSEIGRRSFGRPTCMAVSTVIAIGTSKGTILVFDHQQNLKTVIGQGTKAIESGSVTALALSADHSTIAGGHAAGDIFTWEISRSARPFLHIPPLPPNQHRRSDGHVSGVSIAHVGFLGTRRTALVSANNRGMAFSHLATRGLGAVARTVKTTRILGRYPDFAGEHNRPPKPSSVFAFSPLPMGKIDQLTDTLGLVAMLTPYLLVIISTTPVAQTQHKSVRPKEVASHSVMTAALAWFPAIELKGKTGVSKTKLVYCWSNLLTILEVSELDTDERHDGPPTLDFRLRSRWRAKEAIVAVQWMSRSVLAVLTITQQLLILEDTTLRMTDSFDLIHKHIYHIDLFSSQLRSLVEQYNEEDASLHGVVGDAFHMSFRVYKGRLFLLGYNDISVGILSNWADRLLALMEAGDFIAAIRLATVYYIGDAEKLTVGLPEEDDLRHLIVQEKLPEMMSASLKYAFGRNIEANTERLEKSQLEELADACIAACVYIGDLEFLWDDVYNWYEEHGSHGIFLDVLEPYILKDTVRSLPPTALKALINHFASNHTSERLEEIICLLDTQTMDIEQVTNLCKEYNLYDAFIYVWNRTLRDYIGPLVELTELAGHIANPMVSENGSDNARSYNNAMKMFPYLSFTLTGRIYPTGEEMDEEEATVAKTALYTYLFSGSQVSTDVRFLPHAEDSFASLRKILRFDASSFMSMLNEAFEDSFLNEAVDPAGDSEAKRGDTSSREFLVNRQYLLSILLQVMASPPFGPANTIYLDIFIARNLPKYPQYILLSGTTLHKALIRLCNYPSEDLVQDCELSVEYLLSVYHPPDLQSLIPVFKKAQFFRVLKSAYRTEKQFSELITVYLEESNDQQSVFTCIQDCLRPGFGLSKKQQQDVLRVLQSHADQLAHIDTAKAAQTIEGFAPELHEYYIHALGKEERRQYEYLSTLLQPGKESIARGGVAARLENWMIERYVRLMCQYEPSHVVDYVDVLRAGDLRLEEVLPSMEDSGVVDAAVILLARQGQVRSAMDRLIRHLGTLESGLVGILRNASESPDSGSTAEAINDLTESLDKYSRVGTWLCQGQTRTATRVGNGVRSGKRGTAIYQSPLSFEENLWLDLIDAVVRVARSVTVLLNSGDANVQKASLPILSTSRNENTRTYLISISRSLVQHVFTALLTSTTKAVGPSPSERTDVSFLLILRAFLARAASWSPSLSELRAVLTSIFSVYTYEESLLTLANGILDKDLFMYVDEVTKIRQRGWRPRGQICEICRRRVWGPGTGAQLWEAWEKRQSEEARNREMNRLASRVTSISSRKGKEAATSCEPGSIEQQYRLSALVSCGDNVSNRNVESLGLPERQGEVEVDVDSKPVIVFACRHLYHRQCLLNEPHDHSLGRNHTDLSSLRDHHDPRSELFCPVCT